MNGDPIKFKLGGDEIVLPVIMNFACLERAWPAIKALAEGKDFVGRTAAALAIASAVVLPSRPELTVAEMKARLRTNPLDGGDEAPGLFVAIDALLHSSGLVPAGNAAAPGEPAPVETVSDGKGSSQISSIS